MTSCLAKTALTDVGTVEDTVPRDRNGTFETQDRRHAAERQPGGFHQDHLPSTIRDR